MMPFSPIPVLISISVAWASGLEPGANAEPLLRVGIQVAESAVEISAPSGLLLFDALSGEAVGESPPASGIRAFFDAGTLRLEGMTSIRTQSLTSVRVEPKNGRSLAVGGVRYRGRFELVADERGITAINVVHLEDYLLGVVPLEIGPRTIEEEAAIEAQAVAARTYAVAHLGGHDEFGFDLYGTVADQVYGGLDAERLEATDAVRATAGLILTHDGLPIRAYYHSTCGGETAAVQEVMDRDPAPYLRPVSDRAPDGSDWCSISPRYRWSETRSPADLNGRVRDEVAKMFGERPSAIGTISELSILRRTESGRVGTLAIRGPESELVLDRLDIRFALRDGEGRILGSTDFDLQAQSDGGVRIEGRGFGHGAGMCQWGAIARSRAGQTMEEILATYYPGAALTRVY
jgi:stage II sporulation protein D